VKILLSVIILSTIIVYSPIVKDEAIWIDDFESMGLEDWHGRSSDFHKIYNIDSLSDTSFLSASSLGSDNFIIKKVKVDLVEYPYLNWKWRAKTLPLNGDESQKSTCDIAASVIVVLRASKWRPRSIKYTWSTTLPKSTICKSPFAIWPSRTDIIVMQSGDEKLNEWTSEKVNVLDHYKTFYNKKNVKSKKVEAFVIMTDSDNTKSLSEADYDDIFFSKN